MVFSYKEEVIDEGPVYHAQKNNHRQVIVFYQHTDYMPLGVLFDPAPHIVQLPLCIASS